MLRLNAKIQTYLREYYTHRDFWLFSDFPGFFHHSQRFLTTVHCVLSHLEKKKTETGSTVNSGTLHFSRLRFRSIIIGQSVSRQNPCRPKSCRHNIWTKISMGQINVCRPNIQCQTYIGKILSGRQN